MKVQSASESRSVGSNSWPRSTPCIVISSFLDNFAFPGVNNCHFFPFNFLCTYYKLFNRFPSKLAAVSQYDTIHVVWYQRRRFLETSPTPTSQESSPHSCTRLDWWISMPALQRYPGASLTFILRILQVRFQGWVTNVIYLNPPSLDNLLILEAHSRVNRN